jgi:EAL domain-containing protein (putative c-di-GMP-specific phosphodiesterase class I)
MGGVRSTGSVRVTAGVARALLQLDAAFQPIVAGGEVVGYEALARSPLGPPQALVADAIRAGRRWDVGRRMRALAMELPFGGFLFVNHHPTEIFDPELDRVPHAHAARMVIELTEASPLASIGARGPARVAQLRARGFMVALDDLGAGHNGLAALASLRPDVAKIDRRLVSGLESNPARRQVVRTILSMCHDLDVTPIAEGVETRAEHETLLDLGCGLFQGYYFGRPRREQRDWEDLARLGGPA